MSPKKKAIVIISLFIIMAISVNIAIIAIGGGFSGQGIQSLTNLPTEEDLWKAGQSISDGMKLEYNYISSEKERITSDLDISVLFKEYDADYWNATINIINGTEEIIFNSKISKNNLIFDKKPVELKKSIELLESSIFSIRDNTREPKYLVVGAIWDNINYKLSTIPMKIISKNDINSSQYEFQAYILNYDLDDKKNNIWIVKDLPLPIKAEIHKENNVKYEFTLQNVTK
ncbi:MAG: hypothetical protein ACPKPY_07375 [Nitrososphaeraceae archaeon]